jgi:hypothetical protein
VGARRPSTRPALWRYHGFVARYALFRWRIAIAAAVSFSSSMLEAQVLPPPRDGEIRVAYWELRDTTEVWLTLEPLSPSGERLPISLTINATFPGRRPAAPLTTVELQAHVGALWAPRPELTLLIGRSERIDLGAAGGTLNDSDGTLVGIVGTIDLAILNRMATAATVSGTALRLDFVLDDSQKRAIGSFDRRMRSSDPARATD